MTSKKFKNVMAILMALAMLFTTVGQWGFLTFSHAAEGNYSDDYRLVMRDKTGLTSPYADKSPINMKVGDRLNIGAMVVNKAGYEYTDTDPDYGDEFPLYENIKWKFEEEGLTVTPNGGTHVAIIAKKEGEYKIIASYKGKIQGFDIKPLEITVNIGAKDPKTPEKPIKRLLIDVTEGIKQISTDFAETQVYELQLVEGEKKEISFKGVDEYKETHKPDLSIAEKKDDDNILEATVKGDVLTIKANDGGTPSITVKDKNGAKLKLNIKSKGKSPWIFDKETGTIKGFADPQNNPTHVVIPAEIKGVKVKAIGPKLSEC